MINFHNVHNLMIRLLAIEIGSIQPLLRLPQKIEEVTAIARECMHAKARAFIDLLLLYQNKTIMHHMCTYINHMLSI